MSFIVHCVDCGKEMLNDESPIYERDNICKACQEPIVNPDQLELLEIPAFLRKADKK